MSRKTEVHKSTAYHSPEQKKFLSKSSLKKSVLPEDWQRNSIELKKSLTPILNQESTSEFRASFHLHSKWRLKYKKKRTLKFPVVPSTWAGVGNVSAFLTAIIYCLYQ